MYSKILNIQQLKSRSQKSKSLFFLRVSFFLFFFYRSLFKSTLDRKKGFALETIDFRKQTKTSFSKKIKKCFLAIFFLKTKLFVH